MNTERTLEANLVALQTLHSLLEEVLTLRRHSRDIVLVPLNGSICCLEDLLDRVGNFVTNTVTGDEGNLKIE